MKSSDVFQSKYLRAADLNGKAFKLTMETVSIETLGNDERPVLYFKGADKGLVLNITNWNRISEQYGDDSDGWKGESIELYPTKVDFKGERVDAIRVREKEVAPLPAGAEEGDGSEPPPF